MPTISNRDLAILAGILVLAAVLRIVGLDAPLWFDEIVTLTESVRAPFGELVTRYSTNNHMLYSLEAKAVIALLGEHAWTLRLPAMLFGVASIAAIWWLARPIVGTVQAHVTAGLLAVSYHHIWFSQNARGYTELLFLSILGTILFLDGLRRPSWGRWCGFGLALALAAYTHLTGAFFFAALGLVYLGVLVRRHLWRPAGAAPAGLGEIVAGELKPVAGFALGGLLTLLLYAPLFPDVVSAVGEVSQTSAVDAMKEYQNPLWTLVEAVRTLTGPGALMALIGAGALVLTGLGIAVTARREPLFGWIVVASIALTAVMLSLLSMRIWPRFFFVDIGFIMMLIVAGVAAVCGFLAEKARALVRLPVGAGSLFALACLAMVALSGLLAARNYEAPKQDLEGAYRLVESERAPGDRIYAVGVGRTPFVTYYRAGWGDLATRGELEASLAAPGRTYVIVAFPQRARRAQSEVMGAVEAELETARLFPGTLGDGNVLVFRSR
ncbi:MAG: glycosyltransferase family 39 protein [Alphaproteobacteria bacterium]|nr:glycosyltransferase family 39 protein [Alphaproteobacteria bacterium]